MPAQRTIQIRSASHDTRARGNFESVSPAIANRDGPAPLRGTCFPRFGNTHPADEHSPPPSTEADQRQGCASSSKAQLAYRLLLVRIVTDSVVSPPPHGPGCDPINGHSSGACSISHPTPDGEGLRLDVASATPGSACCVACSRRCQAAASKGTRGVSKGLTRSLDTVFNRREKYP